MASPGNMHCANRLGTLSFPFGVWTRAVSQMNHTLNAVHIGATW